MRDIENIRKLMKMCQVVHNEKITKQEYEYLGTLIFLKSTEREKEMLERALDRTRREEYTSAGKCKAEENAWEKSINTKTD